MNEEKCQDSNISNFTTTTSRIYQNPDSCVFVASLNSSESASLLRDSIIQLFKRWGKIRNVNVQFKQSMPFAFVHYESCEEAETALKNAPGKFLNGRRIRVEKAKVNRSLFIKFPDNKSTPEIFQNLKKFGTIEKFIRGKSGSAFVKYNFREDALDAFSSLKQENNVNAEWVSSKNYIFISNLDVTVDYCKLYNRFSNHGDITNFQLFYYYDLKNIFALINYKLHDSCIDAVINEDMTEQNNQKITVCMYDQKALISLNRLGVFFRPFNEILFNEQSFPIIQNSEYPHQYFQITQAQIIGGTHFYPLPPMNL